MLQLQWLPLCTDFFPRRLVNIKLIGLSVCVYEVTVKNTFNVFLLQELYENLEKSRPNLFRLASDTDDKDSEGISEFFVLLYVTPFEILVKTCSAKHARGQHFCCPHQKKKV